MTLRARSELLKFHYLLDKNSCTNGKNCAISEKKSGRFY